MKTAFFLLLTVVCLSACQWEKQVKKDEHNYFTDTLAYTSQTIHKRAADCGSKADSACTVVQIRYPLFKGQPVLNDSIKHKLLHTFMFRGKPDTGLNSLTTDFLKAYTESKKSDPRSQIFYRLDLYARVIKQDSALLTLEYGGYTFRGGAHGASFTGFVNWDVKTRKTVTLDDIMVSGYHDKLNRIAEKIFRKEEQLADTSSLARDYFFKDNKFALNNNYAITPTGIRFVYNQYEIKPYAAGQTELVLPYSQIRILMKPRSVASQYISKNGGI